MVMGEVKIGFRPDNIPPIIQVILVDCCVYLLLIVVFAKVFMTMKEMIVSMMMEDVDLGLKIPTTLIMKILKHPFKVYRISNLLSSNPPYTIVTKLSLHQMTLIHL